MNSTYSEDAQISRRAKCSGDGESYFKNLSNPVNEEHLKTNFV
jgi:hypothetical protein